MPILTAPIDFQFICLAITIIAGFFVLYKLVRHYQLIKSREYLIIIIVFFNITFFAIYRIWRVYFSYDRIWSATFDDRFWDFGILYLILQIIWGIGIVALLIHIYRLIEWRRRHPLIKGILILFFIEGVLQAFYYILQAIALFTLQDWALLSGPDAWYPTHIWYLQIWTFHLFFGVMGGIMVYLCLLYFLVGLAYLTTKPIHPTRNINFARLSWILFGFANAAKWILYSGLFFEPDWAYSIVPGFEFFDVLGTLAIMLVLAIIPETLLLTEYQLLQTTRLYQVVDRQQTRGGDTKHRFQFIDTEKSVFEYIKKLPPEILPEEVVNRIKNLDSL